jgi:hypothetical protein
MLVCERCGKEFSNNPIINGIRTCLHNRKFCLDCVPLQPRYKRNYSKPKERLCKFCGKDMKSCRGSVCMVCQHKKSRMKLKLKAIEYLGGKCFRCGWSGHPAAFAFHHINEDEKQFEICESQMKSWDKIEQELKKCMLLCSNCHMVEHSSATEDFIFWVKCSVEKDKRSL